MLWERAYSSCSIFNVLFSTWSERQNNFASFGYSTNSHSEWQNVNSTFNIPNILFSFFVFSVRAWTTLLPLDILHIPIGRASDRHAANAGSIPLCGKGFSSKATFNAEHLSFFCEACRRSVEYQMIAKRLFSPCLAYESSTDCRQKTYRTDYLLLSLWVDQFSIDCQFGGGLINS